MSSNTNSGAGILLVSRETQHLCFVRRSSSVDHYPNTWSLIAGGVEEKETPEIAAWREAHEEAKLTGKPTLFKIYTDVDKESGFVFHNFLAFSASDLKLKLNWENTKYEWVEFGKWPRPLHPGVKRMLLIPRCLQILKYACKNGSLPNSLRVSKKSNIPNYS